MRNEKDVYAQFLFFLAGVPRPAGNSCWPKRKRRLAHVDHALLGGSSEQPGKSFQQESRSLLMEAPVAR